MILAVYHKIFKFSHLVVGGLLLFLSLALSATPKLSQHYAYRYFSTRDGLVQMQLLCAFQDSDGYMWFGTKGGVSRWDGTTFKNYNSEDGLQFGEIQNISEWGTRRLIFTSRKMAILEQNDSIYIQNLPDKMVLNGRSQKSLAIDNDNILIFGLFEEYIDDMDDPSYNFVYNIKTKKFTKITNFHHTVIYVFDKYIVTTQGLYYWTGKEIRLKLTFPFDVIFAVFDRKFEHCAIEKKRVEQHELFKITNGHFERISKPIPGSVYRCTWLADGTFLSLRNGMHQFIPERKTRLHENITYPNFSFVDKENNLWIGTENGLYNFFNLNIEEYNFNLGTPDNIWSIVEDKSGIFWLGSYGNGLFLLDKNGDLKKLDFSKKLTSRTKAANQHIYMGSTTDEANNVYISTALGVAKFIDSEFNSISSTPACLYTYYDKPTSKIMYSGIDTTTLRRGLFVGMNDDRKFYPFVKGYPICIIRDGNGVVRVGGFRGTGRLQNEQLVVDTLKRKYSGVLSMALDSHKRLWKATEKGIYVELSDGTEFRISPTQLTGHYTSLAIYKNKFLIAGGTLGFAIVDISKSENYSELEVINTGYEGGFTGLESGQNGILVDTQGYVWLTTALNVLRFNPVEIVKNQLRFAPPLRISNISFSNDNTNWQSHFFTNGSVKISPDNKFFRIDYIANSLSAPKSLRFRYRLTGLSDEWSTPVYTKSVNYTNIRYGSYNFEVQCSTDGINWSHIVSSPTIVIVQPLRLRWWAIISYILLFILLISLTTRHFMQRKEHQRFEALQRLKLENELQLNTLRSKLIPHFTKNVLSAIAHFAMTDKLKAGHYISVFSKFTGLTLTNADKNYISLHDELDYILKYLELEKMRFGNKFDFEIMVDHNISEDVKLPTMTLHTYCDNAIRHGLVPKQDSGKLILKVTKVTAGVSIEITDNGIGRQNAKEMETHGNGQGLKLVQAQIDFYNQTNEHKIIQTITDLKMEDGSATGTKISLFIPDNYLFE